MKKHELIDSISVSSGQPRQMVRAVLDAAADAVRGALASGAPVFLFGLGKLTVSHRGEKRARNIWTGEAVTVPARNVVLYRSSASVDDAINTRSPAPSQE